MVHTIIKPSEYIGIETAIKYQLEAKGYIVQDYGYERYFQEKARGVISQINSPTSLYIRTSPDKVVINTNESFLLEIKDGNEPNIALEAFPILTHRQLFWSFGVKTLYLFVTNNDVTGEYVENLPISRVIIPMRLRTSETKYWTPILKYGFPNNKIERLPTGGSGDPFVLIDHTQRISLRRFDDLLKERTNENRPG